MKKFWAGLIIGIVLCGIAGGIIGISMVGKKAIVAPPAWETFVVGTLKHMRIPEASPPATPVENTDENALTGGEHFGHHCAVCHDLEGDADSNFARSFYPPVADLTSSFVQGYTDGQLKWIVNNGIRYTGMPGWKADIGEDTQWDIVYYMRALANREKAKKLEDTLKQKGLWKVEPPTLEEKEHEEEAGEHEHAESSEEQSHEKEQGEEGKPEEQQSPEERK